MATTNTTTSGTTEPACPTRRELEEKICELQKTVQDQAAIIEDFHESIASMIALAQWFPDDFDD